MKHPAVEELQPQDQAACDSFIAELMRFLETLTGKPLGQDSDDPNAIPPSPGVITCGTVELDVARMIREAVERGDMCKGLICEVGQCETEPSRIDLLWRFNGDWCNIDDPRIWRTGLRRIGGGW